MACMQRVYFLIFLAALFLFLGLFAISFHLQQRELRDKKPTFEPSAEKPLSREADGIDAFMLESGTNADPAPLSDRVDPALQAEFKKLEKFLATKPEREAILKFLGELSEKILAWDPDSAAATLLEFLRTGKDQPTGLDFLVGEGGLEEWPSLRAYLLDLLGKLDPGAASRYALAEVIPAKNSTAEYAVSLQILWNHAGAENGPPELTQAWLGLLQKPDWADRPDAAWMESLDFASRIPEATPAFLEASTGWLARPGQAAGKAETAEMVLERMVIRHPDETLGALLQNSQWMSQGRGPALRATMFARADIAEPSQASLLKTYLERLDPQGPEATAFYRAFPCLNFGVAPGLSGQAEVPGMEEIRARLQAAEALFLAWEKDPTLAAHQERLAMTLAKLRELQAPAR